MLALLRADADLTTQKQRRVTLIAAFLTLLAAVFGLVFSLLVSAGVTRPMGDTVSLASRLEGANKEYGGRILVSEATIAGASDAVEAREIDRVAVLGQNRSQAVFEIMGRKGELLPAQVELRDRFSEGLAAYRSQRWDEARHAFEAALVITPNDGPSITFIKRLDKLTLNS